MVNFANTVILQPQNNIFQFCKRLIGIYLESKGEMKVLKYKGLLIYQILFIMFWI